MRPNKNNGTLRPEMNRADVLDYQKSKTAKMVGMDEQPKSNPDDVIGYAAKLHKGNHLFYQIIYFTVKNDFVYRHDTQWGLNEVIELLSKRTLDNEGII